MICIVLREIKKSGNGFHVTLPQKDFPGIEEGDIVEVSLKNTSDKKISTITESYNQREKTVLTNVFLKIMSDMGERENATTENAVNYIKVRDELLKIVTEKRKYINDKEEELIAKINNCVKYTGIGSFDISDHIEGRIIEGETKIKSGKKETFDNLISIYKKYFFSLDKKKKLLNEKVKEKLEKKYTDIPEIVFEVALKDYHGNISKKILDDSYKNMIQRTTSSK